MCDDYTLVERARAFALVAHGDQMYGDDPYISHLDAVAGLVEEHDDRYRAVAYLHDVLEDTRCTEYELQLLFGDELAALVSLITDPQGATRFERKQALYAKVLEADPDAAWAGPAFTVKVADRLSNVQACILDGNQHKLAMYVKENPDFSKAFYNPEARCQELWTRLNLLINAYAMGAEAHTYAAVPPPAQGE